MTTNLNHRWSSAEVNRPDPEAPSQRRPLAPYHGLIGTLLGPQIGPNCFGHAGGGAGLGSVIGPDPCGDLTFPSQVILTFGSGPSLHLAVVGPVARLPLAIVATSAVVPGTGAWVANDSLSAGGGWRERQGQNSNKGEA
jgi:hypothetical protein